MKKIKVLLGVIGTSIIAMLSMLVKLRTVERDSIQKELDTQHKKDSLDEIRENASNDSNNDVRDSLLKSARDRD